MIVSKLLRYGRVDRSLELRGHIKQFALRLSCGTANFVLPVRKAAPELGRDVEHAPSPPALLPLNQQLCLPRRRRSRRLRPAASGCALYQRRVSAAVSRAGSVNAAVRLGLHFSNSSRMFTADC